MLSQVGPYRIDGDLGRGGMGVVYRATDTRLGRSVAVKALPAEFAADPARLERFQREARTLAQLNHPNLAGIHGVEEQGGNRYLVLEYVEGEPLSDRLDRGPLPADEAVDLAVQIAAGVEAAHEAGVIHRDLKPANIMVTPDGRAKVLDFGLARSDEERSMSAAGDAPTLSSPALPGDPGNSPTIEGAILGTAAYMSPEQARGRRADKRTDIWSFGVVLYEMLTGASPFVGETASDSIGAVLHKDLDFDRLPRETPAHVRRVLERCLQRDKAMRYRAVGDAGLDLAQPLPHAQNSAAEHRSIMPLVAAFTAVILGLVGALTFTMLDREQGPVARAASPVRASVMGPEGFRMSAAAISTDGRRVVMIGDVIDPEREDASLRDIAYVRDLGSGETRQIGGLRDVTHAAFSPNGRWVVFATRSDRGVLRDLYRAPANLSVEPIRIGAIPESGGVSGYTFAWTPTNEIVFLDGPTQQLVLLSAATGDEVRRVPLDRDEADGLIGSFYGPLGKHWVSVIVPRFSEGTYGEDVFAVDLRNGESKRVVRGARNPIGLGNGRLLFSRGSQIFETAFDTETMQTLGAIRPVHGDLATAYAWSHGAFTVSQNGTLAYLPGGLRGARRTVVQLDMQFNESEWSDEKRAFEGEVAISPDAQRIAVTLSSPGGLFEIWVAERDRPRFRRLLASRDHDFNHSVFTVDGESVLAAKYDPDLGSAGEVVRVRFDGSGGVESLYTSEPGASAIPASASSDGSTLLAFEVTLTGERQVIEIPLDSAEPARAVPGFHRTTSSLRHAPAGVPLVSYISSESGAPRLFVRSLNGGGFGTPIPVSDEDVIASGWHAPIEGGAELSYLRADRAVLIRPVLTGGGIRIGEPRRTDMDVPVYLDVEMAPGIGGVAVKRGDDEGPITRVDIVTNWLQTLDN
ncbi:MAG: protein kinase [Planctomycetota bacterium]